MVMAERCEESVRDGIRVRVVATRIKSTANGRIENTISDKETRNRGKQADNGTGE